MFSNFSFSGSPSFIQGRCPGSKAPIFNQTNSFATAPIISLNERSFTISFWIKQTEWVHDQYGAIYGDWHTPWQFLISTRNQKIVFNRHSIRDTWPFLESDTLPLSNWTNVIITWEHTSKRTTIYADGKEVGNREDPTDETFYGPSGQPYMIGNDGHWDNHQFNGSVMDVYVFGTALSPDEINKLRGERLTISHFDYIIKRIWKSYLVPNGT